MADSASEIIRRLGMSEGDFRQDSVAIIKVLNARASVSNLQVMTIHTTKKGFGKLKCACENCTAAFKDTWPATNPAGSGRRSDG